MGRLNLGGGDFKLRQSGFSNVLDVIKANASIQAENATFYGDVEVLGKLTANLDAGDIGNLDEFLTGNQVNSEGVAIPVFLPTDHASISIRDNLTLNSSTGLTIPVPRVKKLWNQIGDIVITDLFYFDDQSLNNTTDGEGNISSNGLPYGTGMHRPYSELSNRLTATFGVCNETGETVTTLTFNGTTHELNSGQTPTENPFPKANESMYPAFYETTANAWQTWLNYQFASTPNLKGMEVVVKWEVETTSASVVLYKDSYKNDLLVTKNGVEYTVNGIECDIFKVDKTSFPIAFVVPANVIVTDTKYEWADSMSSHSAMEAAHIAATLSPTGVMSSYQLLTGIARTPNTVHVCSIAITGASVVADIREWFTDNTREYIHSYLNENGHTTIDFTTDALLGENDLVHKLENELWFALQLGQVSRTRGDGTSYTAHNEWKMMAHDGGYNYDVFNSGNPGRRHDPDQFSSDVPVIISATLTEYTLEEYWAQVNATFLQSSISVDRLKERFQDPQTSPIHTGRMNISSLGGNQVKFLNIDKQLGTTYNFYGVAMVDDKAWGATGIDQPDYTFDLSETDQAKNTEFRRVTGLGSDVAVTEQTKNQIFGDILVGPNGTESFFGTAEKGDGLQKRKTGFNISTARVDFINEAEDGTVSASLSVVGPDVFIPGSLVVGGLPVGSGSGSGTSGSLAGAVVYPTGGGGDLTIPTISIDNSNDSVEISNMVITSGLDAYPPSTESLNPTIKVDTTNDRVQISNLVLTNGLTNYSDRTMKYDIHDTKLDALDMVSNLRLREYRWKGPGGSFVPIGFIAQELEEINPYFVTDVNGKKAIKTVDLVPMLTKAVQELMEENKKLSRRIETLETKT